MAKLKLIVDKLDDVPEAQRELYTEGDDKRFYLGVDGIEDTTGLKKALKAERDARADFEKKLKAFDGVDPDEAKALREKLENDEELQLIKTGQKDKLKERWTEKMRTDLEKRIKTAEDAVVAESKRASKWSARVLDNAVREAAAKVGIHSHAVEDALYRGRSMFTLDEDGNAVQVRDGSVILGKDGKTPYSPAEWLESMRESAPHWFPAMASGGGATQTPPRGNGSGNGQQRTIKRAAFDQLDPKGKMAFVKEGGAVVD